MSSSNASPPSAASRSLSEDEPRKLVGKFKEFEALLLRDGDVETKALELQAAAADLDAKFSTDGGGNFRTMAQKMTTLMTEMKDASDTYTEQLQNCAHPAQDDGMRKCDEAFDRLERSRSNVHSAFEELGVIIESCHSHSVTHVAIETADKHHHHRASQSSLQKRAISSELGLEAMHQCIKVKQEHMEESFAKEAQLESTVSAMSADVSQLSRMLEECREMLECCVCLQRAVRIVVLPCGHHFCGSADCYSSEMSECPTCRRGITGRTPLFGACMWLAEAFEGMGDAAVSDVARHHVLAEDTETSDDNTSPMITLLKRRNALPWRPRCLTKSSK